ncbi:MAG: OsmC family peroxiredoxin [Rhodospirillaceae bacterium]|nr:MAG: OsmC family peroxiredoxin [Rhodospirillaceae bacterium]
MNDKVLVRAEAVDVRESGRGKYTIDIAIGPHALVADEPREAGGDDAGPRPHEFVLAGLGACTAMTLRMYADRKGIPLKHVSVHLIHHKIKAADCPDCVTKEGEVEEMIREIKLEGDFDAATRQKLLEIANKCPVHRTLTGEIKIRTLLVD